MKAVLDTNVIVSSLLTCDGNCERIMDWFFQGRFTICVSHPILAEYEEVLARPRLKIAHERAAALLAEIRGSAKFASARMKPVPLPDHDDQIFLGTALNSHADFLVTGNLKDFPPRLCRGVRVIPPAEFLELLRR
jgi:uncharacterized protein